LGAQTCLANTRQGHGKKNQVGNWGRKTKLTQGASVNTPRHCSEMFLYFLRILAARQMEYLLCEALEILVNMHRRRPLRAYKKPPLAHSLF
jgi:hypothetical protein